MAADSAETFLGGVAPHKQKTGQGLKCLVYQVVKAAQADYTVFGDFTNIVDATAHFNVSQGSPEGIVVGATTANAITWAGAGTGTLRVIVLGY